MKDNLDPSALHIDFLSPQLLYRCQHATLRTELVARAMGCRPSEHPLIVDATAGLGRDSLILAYLGFEVIMLERSALLVEQLHEALLRAKQHPDMAPVVERMHLIHIDACEWLAHPPLDRRPEVVYLDPMFPKRKKSASVKKEMVMLQQLLGTDADHALLFKTAYACASKRVVVKRPKLAPNIVERAANYTLQGKSSRFDIYLTSN